MKPKPRLPKALLLRLGGSQVGRYLPTSHWSLTMSIVAGVSLLICVGLAVSAPSMKWTAIAAATLITACAILAGMHVSTLLRQIARLAEDKERSLRDSLIDSLTGLPNRLAFRSHLEASMIEEGNSPVAVLFADLDRFKDVNDRLGHDAGDALLVEIAERFAGEFQERDLLARLGGDEFAAILIGEDALERVRRIVPKLIAHAQEPFVVKETVVGVGVSVGMASARASEASCEELLRRADIAMYRAKADGDASFASFVDEMDDSIRLNRALRADLDASLRDGDLRMDLQPIFDARTGRIVGAEALMRWTHPEEGELSPNQFITLAEESGQIIELGEWALDSLLETLPQLGDLPVAINVSPVQFRHDGFAAMVGGKLAASGVDPRRLRIEITEGVLIAHTAAAKRTIRQLRDLGVQVILDDFGTGYSSLSYLQTFQFDEVKIDRSFVRNIGRQDNSARLARAIIDVGHGLGMAVTAEGIENPHQAQLLKLLGCDRLQGFHLGLPGSVRELQRLIQDHAQIALIDPSIPAQPEARSA